VFKKLIASFPLFSRYYWGQQMGMVHSAHIKYYSGQLKGKHHIGDPIEDLKTISKFILKA